MFDRILNEDFFFNLVCVFASILDMLKGSFFYGSFEVLLEIWKIRLQEIFSQFLLQMVMEEEAFLLKSCFDGIIVMKLNVSNDYFFFFYKQLSNG